jgi:diguanylate cyclase (GGDEF)-like protein
MRRMNDFALSHTILDSLLDHVALIDKEGVIIFVNKPWISYVFENDGDSTRCGLGVNYLEFCKELDGVYEGIHNVLNGEQEDFSFEYPCDTVKQEQWFLMRVSPLRIHMELMGAVVSHINITPLKVMERSLQELASTDALTSLYNRRYLENKFKEEVLRTTRYKHPLSFMMIDIDHFKRVNDSYGHAIGDKVLVEISRILQKNVRETDVCTRFGGEEFAILLPETGEAELLKIAEKIHALIQNYSFDIEPFHFKVTVSIGIITQSENLDVQAIIEAADKALYNAKNNGRNQICVYT